MYLVLLISVTLFPLTIGDSKVNFIPIGNLVKDFMVGVNTMGFFYG